jgi:glycine cleavage system H protein
VTSSAGDAGSPAPPQIPDDLRYTAEHEWVRAVGGGAGDETGGGGATVRVGITDYAQHELGDIVYVSLPAVGDQVAAGQSCGEVESTKSVSDLYAPVTGTVVAVNAELDAAPELLNTDPYEGGWMIEIAADDAGSVAALLDAAAYRGLVDSA